MAPVKKTISKKKTKRLTTYSYAYGFRSVISFSISNPTWLSILYALRCVHSVVGLHMASLQELLQNAGVQDTLH